MPAKNLTTRAIHTKEQTQPLYQGPMTPPVRRGQGTLYWPPTHYLEILSSLPVPQADLGHGYPWGVLPAWLLYQHPGQLIPHTPFHYSSPCLYLYSANFYSVLGYIRGPRHNYRDPSKNFEKIPDKTIRVRKDNNTVIAPNAEGQDKDEDLLRQPSTACSYTATERRSPRISPGFIWLERGRLEARQSGRRRPQPMKKPFPQEQRLPSMPQKGERHGTRRWVARRPNPQNIAPMPPLYTHRMSRFRPLLWFYHRLCLSHSPPSSMCLYQTLQSWSHRRYPLPFNLYIRLLLKPQKLAPTPSVYTHRTSLCRSHPSWSPRDPPV